MNKEKETTLRREMHVKGVHLRQAGDGTAGESRTIEGRAILFGVPSEPLWDDEHEDYREVIDPQAVTRQLLDASDIKFTMFHNRQLILARSNKGKGTLTYEVDEQGVTFRFDAPATVDGDKALELVKRGDLSGCSFMFSTRYWDNDYVERSVVFDEAGKKHVTCRVKRITGIYDFTLAADPAYAGTEVETRQLREMLAADQAKDNATHERERSAESVSRMRLAARQKMI